MKINACIKCEGKDIKIRDCGYSSFNCGSAKCKKCGNEIKSQNLSCLSEEAKEELIKIWNKNNPTKAQQIVLLEKEIPKLEALVKEKKLLLTKLKISNDRKTI
jgi:uncharacterized protein (UPF0212 family)